jgi:putative FmdB family regulatory protein
MPTYEYECKNCGHHLEIFQSMKDDPLKKCPECGKNKLSRLIGTGAGIIFKGDGFYCTDYRSENYKKSESKDKETGNNNTSGKSKDGGAKQKNDNSSTKTGD